MIAFQTEPLLELTPCVSYMPGKYWDGDVVLPRDGVGCIH
jgi:hypothetical protein